MQKFEITLNAEGLNIGLVHDGYTDLYLLTLDEAKELLACITTVLDGGVCPHTVAHRLELNSINLFNLLMAVSERYTKAYTVNKRKLIDLRIELMGALNG